MPIEKRTRVEIFLPLRSDIPAYNTALQWMAEEFAYERGGATLTAPFAGLFVSSNRLDVVEDAIRILYCDFDLDVTNAQDLAGLTSFLESVKRFLMETLEEEEIWIIYFPVTRIVS
ncbi:MAG: hypothetical protein HOP17_10860 [Acidobacteria bacterium]|nr:hypothetical protein [Acidobacteriota bacterium]